MTKPEDFKTIDPDCDHQWVADSPVVYFYRAATRTDDQTAQSMRECSRCGGIDWFAPDGTHCPDNADAGGRAGIESTHAPHT